MSDEWLDQLRQLHEADKAKYQAEHEKQSQPPPNQASNLLRQSKAHELLRQVQKALLGGKGYLDIFERDSDYERVITLVWQGPVSNARKPDPDDPDDFRYILVGVRQGQLWVNGKPVSSATPEALKAALLKASQNPGREKQSKDNNPK